MLFYPMLVASVQKELEAYVMAAEPFPADPWDDDFDELDAETILENETEIYAVYELLVNVSLEAAVEYFYRLDTMVRDEVMDEVENFGDTDFGTLSFLYELRCKAAS